MLDLGFPEISQHFSFFRQLFIVSKGGPKEKNPQKPMYSFGNFSAFFLWSPIGNYEKKLDFCEVSEKIKSSI
jgi:hypothetical protein